MNKGELKEKVLRLFEGNIEYFDSLYARIDFSKSTKNNIIVEIIPQIKNKESDVKEEDVKSSS